MLNYYEVLGVTRASTKDEIRSAYIIKAKAEHPDVGGVKDDFVDIVKAYKVLHEPAQRRIYDEFLKQEYRPCPVCKGRGVLFKQKSFTERVNTRCLKCKGTGVLT